MEGLTEQQSENALPATAVPSERGPEGLPAALLGAPVAEGEMGAALEGTLATDEMDVDQVGG